MDALPYLFLWVESVIRRMLRMGHGEAVAAPVKPVMPRRLYAAGLAKVPATPSRLRRRG